MTLFLLWLWENINGDIMKNNDNIYTLIGQNIKKYRKSKGYTQEQLASKTNLSYGYIKNLEAKGVYASISIETLQIIAHKLEISIDKLFESNK